VPKGLPVVRRHREFAFRPAFGVVAGSCGGRVYRHDTGNGIRISAGSAGRRRRAAAARTLNMLSCVAVWCEWLPLCPCACKSSSFDDLACGVLWAVVGGAMSLVSGASACA
jgi:hypothetical protein